MRVRILKLLTCGNEASFSMHIELTKCYILIPLSLVESGVTCTPLKTRKVFFDRNWELTAIETFIFTDGRLRVCPNHCWNNGGNKCYQRHRCLSKKPSTTPEQILLPNYMQGQDYYAGYLVDAKYRWVTSIHKNVYAALYFGFGCCSVVAAGDPMCARLLKGKDTLNTRGCLISK